MALSSREKYIALGVGATVLFAGFYQLVIDPFMDESQAITTKRLEVKKQLDAADILFKRRVALRHVWTDITTVGELKNDTSEAKTQMTHLFENWALESGVTWTSLSSEDHLGGVPVDRKSDKPESKFERSGLHATGFGPMASITKLLWRVESAPNLLKIIDMHITPRKEATDDLQIQLSVATVSLLPDTAAPKATEAPRPAAKSDNGIEP